MVRVITVHVDMGRNVRRAFIVEGPETEGGYFDNEKHPIVSLRVEAAPASKLLVKEKDLDPAPRTRWPPSAGEAVAAWTRLGVERPRLRRALFDLFDGRRQLIVITVLLETA